MIASIETVFAEAMALPDASRLQLVERLIPTIQSDPDFETEQYQEVQRRVTEVRAGQVKTLPGEQVFEGVRRSLASRRPA